MDVTVRDSQLKPCKDDERVCVTDLRDCGPRPSSSVQKTLNISCYYQKSADGRTSMTCGWPQESSSHTESDASLIFTSGYKTVSCQGIFNPAAVLKVTARIKHLTAGGEIWSEPHTVDLYYAVKPIQPVLTALGSTEDSLVVSWRSSREGRCRLRYRINNTRIWTQAPDYIAAQADLLTCTIKDLLPFTTYRAAVACRGRSGVWSDWSADISGRTLDRVPSRPLEVCYRVEEKGSGGSSLLHLLWKAPDPREAGGRVLGYQVSHEPNGLIQNVTELTTVLAVEEVNCTVTVTAFNTAGYGPAAHLRLNTQRQSSGNLWISSSYPGKKALLVQWNTLLTASSAPPVSHFAVRWRSEKSLSTSRWSRVDSLTTSTVIEDVEPDESYLITVSPVYNHQFGSPQSLSASLQQGALMEAVSLKVVGVTKMTVTIVWAWQKKSGPIRVNRYRVLLRKDSDRQALSLWPDQWQHSFFNLTPNTEYSLLLLADNVSMSIVPVTTYFDVVSVVATATTLLLLSVIVLIISILSRTECINRNILDIKDFQVTDILGEKSLIVVDPDFPRSSEDNLQEDTSLLPTLQLDTQLATFTQSEL
ncbi:interleukin-6 receptor subunit beta [Brachyistius frenatus]|uniref:interleukin-6 receptor subunit beta n=1 Tax=Brachyistius frenatus TaxID=100188 RepID=UPI0037E72BD9